MSSRFLRFVALCGIALLLGACSTQADEAKARRHRWFVITYPKFACPWIKGTARPAIYPIENGDKGPGFLLNMWLSPDADLLATQDFVEPKPSELKIRLHYPDGKIVEPKSLDIHETNESGPGSGTGRKNFNRQLECIFPWGPNDLSETWIEVRFPDEVVWLAMPYGFARNPNDPLCPPTRGGPPQFAPAMKPLEKNAKLANWQIVGYPNVDIQNGWKMSINHSNPFDARSEIVLYREDHAIGKSMFLWDLHTPRTSVTIQQPGRHTLESLAKGIRLSSDGYRRIDSFDFNRNGGSNEVRTWGTMVVKVDDKTYEQVVPSSLFGYVHGTAESDNKAYLPATPEIRD